MKKELKMNRVAARLAPAVFALFLPFCSALLNPDPESLSHRDADAVDSIEDNNEQSEFQSDPEDVETGNDSIHDFADTSDIDEIEEEIPSTCGNGELEGVEECDPPDSSISCITTCGSSGVQTCNASCSWGVCVQPEEECNGLDDDCDTICDNGFDCCSGLTEVECTNPVGVEGTKDCDSTCLWSECCSPTEVCDNEYDDDCDGETDEFGKIGSEARITNDSDSSTEPAIVWTGSEYGAVWVDKRDGGLSEAEIYFALISPAGSKIGSDVRITNAPGNALGPSLAWSGTEFGMVWSDKRDGNTETYFCRLTSSGSKIGSDVRMTFAQSFNTFDHSLSWTGSEYCVAWRDDMEGSWEIYFARISSSGLKIGDDIKITDSGFALDPSLVWTDTEFGIAWFRIEDYKIYFARLSSSGEKMGSDIRITDDLAHSCSPSLIWTGTGFGVAWYDSREGYNEIYFARVSSSGTKIGSDVRISNDIFHSERPSLAWSGTAFGVAWHDRSAASEYKISFASILSSGVKTGSDVIITDDPNTSTYASLVWTGEEFGVAWSDGREDTGDIYFARIGCE